MARQIKRKKASLYGLAKRRGVEYPDWIQERLLQAFLVTGIWYSTTTVDGKLTTTIPEPTQEMGAEEPAAWRYLDEIDERTLKSCVRFDYARPDSETLDKLLDDDSKTLALYEMPDVVEWILAVVPKQLQSYVADAYFGNDPLPRNIAVMIAGYLWQIDEMLPKHWQKAAQMARCVVTVR